MNCSQRIAAMYRVLMSGAATDDGTYQLDVVATSPLFKDLNYEQQEAVLRRMRATLRKDRRNQ